MDKPQNTHRTSLYLPSKILEPLRKQAEKNHRSVNSEIVWVLEQYLAQQQKEKEVIEHK